MIEATFLLAKENEIILVPIQNHSGFEGLLEIREVHTSLTDKALKCSISEGFRTQLITPSVSIKCSLLFEILIICFQTVLELSARIEGLEDYHI